MILCFVVSLLNEGYLNELVSYAHKATAKATAGSIPVQWRQYAMTVEGPMKWRGINFWAHIRNWYEVHSLEDNQRLLEDMATNGFNDLWITLERELFRNYLDEKAADANGTRFWWKLKGLAEHARELGMRVTVLDELNTVFVDQCSDPALADLIADGRRPWGFKKVSYNFCPSKPAAREIILRNHEDAYRDFPHIDAVVLQPYDPSGCGCEACDPWPATYFDLATEIAARLRVYHPQAAVYLSVWDFFDEQVRMMVELLSAAPADLFQGVMDKEWLMLDLKGDGHIAARWEGLPDQYTMIPYIDLCQIGAWGWHCFTANPYPARFETLFKFMRQAGITSYSAYSEDVHDDINKYLIARLGLSDARSARELLEEYSMCYFDAAVGADLYKATRLMEDEYTNKLGSPWEQKPVMNLEMAREMLAILQDVESRLASYVVRGWRWQVLITRAKMSVLINEIGDLGETREEILGLFRRVLDVSTADQAHDLLQQAENLILEKRGKLELLRATADSFRADVLEEPAYRMIRVHKALPSYYSWQKMLVEMEETIAAATRHFLNGIQDAIRERLEIPA
jgi:hypothetical protein